MNVKMIFPKIKKDAGGTPIEYSLEQVSFEEILRAPEDVQSGRDFLQDDDNLRFMPSSSGRF